MPRARTASIAAPGAHRIGPRGRARGSMGSMNLSTRPGTYRTSTLVFDAQNSGGLMNSRRALAPSLAFVFSLAASLAAVTAPARAVNHTVTLSGMAYSPSNLTIQAGDSVTWTNNGGSHNVHAEDGTFRCANGCDPVGEGDPSGNAWSFTRTFDTPG